MSTLLALAYNASILLLAVSGLFVIFGLLRIVNLAHAGLMTVGVYVTTSLLGSGVAFWIAVPISGVLAGAIGLILEATVVRRLYSRPLDTILATWGISLIITQAISMIYGPGLRNMSLPVSGSVTILGVSIQTYSTVLMVTAASLFAVFFAIVRFTGAGLTVRMILENAPLARTIGINVQLARRVAFVVGAALAGMAGSLLGPTQAVEPNYAFGFLILAFNTALLAGRSLAGLLISCIVLGGVQTLLIEYANPTYATMLVLVLAALILRVRSNGFEMSRI